MKSIFFKRRPKKAAIAIMTALIAPVMLGFTAISVDVGYWYTSRTSFQSATEAAAIDASRATIYGVYSSSSLSRVADEGAQNSDPSITNANLTTTENAQTISVYGKYQVNSYLAEAIGINTAQIATSSESGAAGIQTKPESGCLMTFNTSSPESIYASGGSKITANNCGIISESSAQGSGTDNAIVAEPSASIIAQSIGAVGGIYADTNGGAYIGIYTTNGTTINGVTQNMKPVPDPLSGMGDPPAPPLLPSPPYNGTPIDIAKSGHSFGYVAPYSTSWGGCTGNYTADCYVNAGSFTGGISTNTQQMVFQTGTNTPNNSSTYTISGQVTLGSNGPAEMQPGTYWLTGPTNSKGVVDGYALTTDLNSFTTDDGSTFYVNGGFDLGGSTQVVIGSGNYYFQASGASGSYAFTADVPSISFNGGTYVFNGGLNLTSTGQIYFGPGIYIIANGNFDIGGGTKITSNDATFILEDGAAFNFSGGSAELNMVAPSNNCVPMDKYPEQSYVTGSPYDGTNGEGICGILIYQARNDASPDSLSGSATQTFNGIIYAPSAALSMTGASSISTGNPENINLTLGVLVNSLSVTGSSNINLQAAPTSVLSNTNSTTYEPVLVK